MQYSLHAIFPSHHTAIVPPGQLSVDVHPAVPPLPLSEAKEKSVWSYERLLGELEQKEFELMKERLKHQQRVEEEATAKKAAAAARVEAVEPPITKTVRVQVCVV